MRNWTLLLALALSGCGGWYPVALYDHLSNPNKGGCENSSDYFAAGAGYGTDTAKIYITVGAKAYSACIPGIDEYTEVEPGAQLLMVKEFRKSRRR